MGYQIAAHTIRAELNSYLVLLLNESVTLFPYPSPLLMRVTAFARQKSLLNNTGHHSMNSRRQKIAIKDYILFLKLTEDIERRRHEITSKYSY